MTEADVQQRAQMAREAVAEFRKDGLSKRPIFYDHLARWLNEKRSDIKTANSLDLRAAQANGLSKAMIDRLTLNDKRIDDLIDSVKEIKAFTDPLGISEGRRLENGLVLEKIQVGYWFHLRKSAQCHHRCRGSVP
jgi:glutamate-5-semialdehyde dehydrogenase